MYVCVSPHRPVEDEYDQYRAKYRLFDRALFLMSPDNRLRKCCKAVLTRQQSEPPFVRTRLTPINLVKHMLSYYSRLVGSVRTEPLPHSTIRMCVRLRTCARTHTHTQLHSESSALLHLADGGDHPLGHSCPTGRTAV